MNKIRFGEALEVLPSLAPIAAITNDAARVTTFVDLSLCHWVTFICQFGAISATDTGLITVAVEGSTTGADSDTETNVDFSYRISSAIGAAPSLGAIVACESTNTNTVASTDVANGLLIVEVDPSAVQDYRYVRLSIDPAADSTSYFSSAIVVKEPRYPGNALPSLFTST
jgi:hypothetical protein